MTHMPHARPFLGFATTRDAAAAIGVSVKWIRRRRRLGWSDEEIAAAAAGRNGVASPADGRPPYDAAAPRRLLGEIRRIAERSPLPRERRGEAVSEVVEISRCVADDDARRWL